MLFTTAVLLGAHAACVAAALSATVTVDTAAVLARTHPTSFASFSLDFTALYGVERVFIPLNEQLVRLSRNLAPAFFRVGGSFQDRAVVTFPGVPQPPTPPNGFLFLNMSTQVFDGLMRFTDAAGLDLVYGLNAAVGRQSAATADVLPWLADNALAVLDRAAALGQRIAVVELGNEVNVFNCSKDGLSKMSPASLAHAYALTAARVHALLPGTRIWGSDSSITGDVVGQCHDYYGDDLFGFNRDLFAQPEFLSSIDAHTWHYYAQDSRNATSTAALILSPEYQARLPAADALARAVRDAAAPGLAMVLGETASYWAGGRANVSNRFASGFWYLPQLGHLASEGYLTHIRQDIAGGDYGLLDLVLNASGAVTGFTPNPDYFTHALWQRLVSGRSLRARVTNASTARVTAFAACATPAAGGAGEGVTLILVNFSEEAVEVTLAFEGGDPLPSQRQEYLLTPGEGGLTSQGMRLNGNLLSLGAHDDALPPFPARVKPITDALVMEPLSYGFVTLRDARARACAGGA